MPISYLALNVIQEEKSSLFQGNPLIYTGLEMMIAVGGRTPMKVDRSPFGLWPFL
jgi:hypothetical protein